MLARTVVQSAKCEIDEVTVCEDIAIELLEGSVRENGLRFHFPHKSMRSTSINGRIKRQTMNRTSEIQSCPER
jgi:hypothetical protein